MSELIKTALFIGMFCVVQFLMSRMVRRAKNPSPTDPKKPKYMDRPAAVEHEVDRAKKVYGV